MQENLSTILEKKSNIASPRSTSYFNIIDNAIHRKKNNEQRIKKKSLKKSIPIN